MVDEDRYLCLWAKVLDKGDGDSLVEADKEGEICWVVEMVDEDLS